MLGVVHQFERNVYRIEEKGVIFHRNNSPMGERMTNEERTLRNRIAADLFVSMRSADDDPRGPIEAARASICEADVFIEFLQKRLNGENS